MSLPRPTLLVLPHTEVTRSPQLNTRHAGPVEGLVWVVGVVQQRVGLLQVLRAHDGVGVLLGGQEPLHHDHHVTEPSLALELQTKVSRKISQSRRRPLTHPRPVEHVLLCLGGVLQGVRGLGPGGGRGHAPPRNITAQLLTQHCLQIFLIFLLAM